MEVMGMATKQGCSPEVSIRAQRTHLVPARLRPSLYERKGWYWYWTLIGNVRRGPAAELRALQIYLRARTPLWALPRWVLLRLIAFHLRSAPEGEPAEGIKKVILDSADCIIHDTTGYEDPVTVVNFVPRGGWIPGSRRIGDDDGGGSAGE
jgi:hypothetical protein